MHGVLGETPRQGPSPEPSSPRPRRPPTPDLPASYMGRVCTTPAETRSRGGGPVPTDSRPHPKRSKMKSGLMQSKKKSSRRKIEGGGQSTPVRSQLTESKLDFPSLPPHPGAAGQTGGPVRAPGRPRRVGFWPEQRFPGVEFLKLLCRPICLRLLL